jgi:UDP-N-acetylmuramoyl-tripeptide--D-alanyl-D-alanine ligase
MKQTIQNLLSSLSRTIIHKYKPVIVGITGSVGKTSAKEAIFHVASQKYRAYRPVKNFNNEFGFPFAIIGVDTPGRNILKWLGVFGKALSLILLSRQYPEVLILEYGIDRPNDMDYLLAIAKPHVSVITGIGVSHYEFFHNAEAIEHEKGKLAAVLTDEDILIVNADNIAAFRQKEKTTAHVYAYGFAEQADVRAESAQEVLNGKVVTALEVIVGDQKHQFSLHAAGTPHIHAVLAAIAAGQALGIEPSLIAQGVEQYKPLPGRLNVIGGIKHSTVIDDTYNAAPDSTREAVELLARIPASYKIAVLGDMLELGSISDDEHRAIGKLVAERSIHRLITVGPQARLIVEGAITAGFPESKISSWDNSEVAKQVVQQQLEPESLILVKGSQGIRMEKITKEIMSDPMRAEELLCRQYGKWINS